MDTDDSGAVSSVSPDSPLGTKSGSTNNNSNTGFVPTLNHTIDPTGRVISFSRAYNEDDYDDDDDEDQYNPYADNDYNCSPPSDDFCRVTTGTPTTPTFRCNPANVFSGKNELDVVVDDDERLASLEALRYALHHAPFCRDHHTLMSVPDEGSLLMQGIPTKCAIRLEEVCTATTTASHRRTAALDHASMEVPKGKIYALLGPAGSGKTALLQCIVGRLKPTSGSVTTFGTMANAMSAICVGYMPQEVALHGELTICQTLHYYGRLYQLPEYEIAERSKALATSLHLPTANTTLVRRLNPGQKWRLSLAVALIHSPPLLLLDEPTVMVDPLIRWSVWKRLERLCEEEGMTVLITTKYPEEIGFAYKMGLMRNGHIYAEDRPEELRARYSASTYDDLYVRFCEANVPRRVGRHSIAPYFGLATNLEDDDDDEKRSSKGGGSVAVDVESPPQSTKSKSKKSSRGSTKSKTSTEGQRKAPAEDKSEVTSDTKPDRLYPILDRLRFIEQQSGQLPPQIQVNDGGGGDSRWDTPPKVSRWPLPMAEWPICERRRSAYVSRFIKLDRKRLLALVVKNLYVIRGNLLPIVIFYFLFPALQMILMCTLLGRTVRHLPVTVPADLALRDNFGPTFVHTFLDQGIFSPVYTANLQAAVEQIQHGKAYAAIVPWTNRDTGKSASSPHHHHSLSSQQQSINNQNKTNDENTNSTTTASNSSSQTRHYNSPLHLTSPQPPCESPQPYGIKLYLDHTNFVIAQTMFYSFIQSMRRFLQSETGASIIAQIRRTSACGGSGAVSTNTIDSQATEQIDWNSTAIDVHEVIYGTTEFHFLEFLLPGFLCSLVFMYSLVLAAYLFIREHIAGLQSRCLTTGTSGVEVLAAHFLSQIGLYIVQQTVILLIVFRLFGLPSRGPFYSLWSLILLQGVNGIAFGLFVAVICPKPRSAALLTSAIFLPGFLLSGIYWPIESMPPVAQHLSHALPLTLPINSLRYIISRGPDMRFSQIVLGFSISAGYIAVLLLLTFAIFKCKTSL